MYYLNKIRYLLWLEYTKTYLYIALVTASFRPLICFTTVINPDVAKLFNVDIFNVLLSYFYTFTFEYNTWNAWLKAGYIKLGHCIYISFTFLQYNFMQNNNRRDSCYIYYKQDKYQPVHKVAIPSTWLAMYMYFFFKHFSTVKFLLTFPHLNVLKLNRFCFITHKRVDQQWSYKGCQYNVYCTFFDNRVQSYSLTLNVFMHDLSMMW